MKIYTNSSGYMTKMAAMPIYGKKPFKNLFLQNEKASDIGTWLCVVFMDVGPTEFVQMMILCWPWST